VKKFLLIGAVVVGLSGLLSGCNPMARKYGGDITIDLPKGEKLVNATWKEDSVWYLTRPMKVGEQEETYIFKEDSTFGLLEGTVYIKEHK
jgi:predicted small secreted protein